MQTPNISDGINPNMNFYNFIFKNRLNKIYLYSSLTLGLIIWSLFKIPYKYPNLVLDSYYYIDAALSNSSVNAWPIGYSKLIQVIGLFSHNANTMVTAQYFLLLISFLCFFFTLRFFYFFNNFTSILLLLFFLINPLFPFASNLILSDSSFTAFSLLWISNLIWIINRPKLVFIFNNGLLLLITFSIRYTALYYPAISIIVFIVSHQSLSRKITGIGIQILLISGFIYYTTWEMNKNYGVKQFSPFGAWKLANNALYMYETVYKEDKNLVPLQFRSLDSIVRDYFNKPHIVVDLIHRDVTSGSFYMFKIGAPHTPLIQYMESIYGVYDTPLYFKSFAPLGPLYKEYGSFLIKKHPILFLKTVVIPNSIRYFHPHTEIFTTSTSFYLRNDMLGNSAKKWFSLKNITVEDKYINLRRKIFKFSPNLNTVIHWFSFMFLAGFLLIHKKQHVLEKYKGIVLLCFLCISNFIFSITAASSLLRYQLFIMIVEFSILVYTSSDLYFIIKKNKQNF